MVNKMTLLASDQLVRVVKFLSSCGLYHLKPERLQELSNEVKKYSEEEGDSNKYQQTQSKFLILWRLLIILFTVVCCSMHFKNLVEAQSYPDNYFHQLGTTLWNLAWLFLYVFTLFWFLFKSNSTGVLIDKIFAFSTDLKIPKYSKYTVLYTINILFGFLCAVFDIYIEFEGCDSSTQLCYIRWLKLTGIWIVFLPMNIGVSLFFSTMVTILMQRLATLCQMKFVQSASQTKLQQTRRICELQLQIVEVYDTVDQIMGLFSWPILLRCIYDILATVLSLSLTIDSIEGKQKDIVSMIMALLWRITGILIYASLADDFDSMVRVNVH